MSAPAAGTMILLRIEYRREADGSVVACFTRNDGTQTWERQKGKRAAYFPVHDLVHHSVESGLKIRCGFYGLIADGWAITEMDGKHPRGPLPRESILVEKLVGLFTMDFASTPLTTEQINAQMRDYATQDRLPRPREFSDQEVQVVRLAVKTTCAKWHALSKGESLRLLFDL